MWNTMNVHVVALAFVTVCSSQHMDYTISTNDDDFLNYYDYPTPHGLRLQYLQSPDELSHAQTQYKPYQSHPAYSTAISAVIKEFDSPDLENAAFTMALTRQGFIIADGGSSTSVAPTSAHLRALTHHHHHHHGQALPKAISQSSSRSNSQNVKLPLPLGATPLTFAALPLQSGAPYSKHRGLTSYGTPYGQRRR